MRTELPPNSISESEAARYVAMSVSWLRQARSRNDPRSPPFLRIGRAVRYRVEDLDQWLESRLHMPGNTHESSEEGA